MEKILKKRLYRYIKKHRWKGYSISQIKKALITYGFEMGYVEKTIDYYKLRTLAGIYLLLGFAITIPFLYEPSITGYFIAESISNSSALIPLFILAGLSCIIGIGSYVAFMDDTRINLSKYFPIDYTLYSPSDKSSSLSLIFLFFSAFGVFAFVFSFFNSDRLLTIIGVLLAALSIFGLRKSK